MNASTIAASPITSFGGIVAFAAGAFHLFTLISGHQAIQPADYEFLATMFSVGAIGLAAPDAKTAAATK